MYKNQSIFFYLQKCPPNIMRFYVIIDSTITKMIYMCFIFLVYHIVYTFPGNKSGLIYPLYLNIYTEKDSRFQKILNLFFYSKYIP